MSKKKATIEDVMALLYAKPLEFQIIPTKTAIVLINLLNCTHLFLEVAVTAGLAKDEVLEALNDFDLRSKKAISNATRLLKACRDKGLEIVYVMPRETREKPQTLTEPTSRIGLPLPSRVELSGVYEGAKPMKGELVFSKRSADVFADTRLDLVLRNMRVDTLIICGLLTDQDVLVSIIQALNLGYNILLVQDACAAITQKAHEAFIKWYEIFVVTRTTEEALKLIT